MEEYEFTGRWIGLSNPPLSGNRVLVTDGEIVIFGTFVGNTWMFEGIHSNVSFDIVYWMPAPKPIEKPKIDLIIPEGSVGSVIGPR